MTTQDAELWLTRGQRAAISLAEHRLRLKVLFEENEAGIAPDTMLRSALLDADRFADEFAESPSTRAALEAAQDDLKIAKRDAQALRKGLDFSPLGDNHHNAAACPYCGNLLGKA